MRRYIFLLALSISWVATSVGTAHASCLAPPALEDAIADARVVFVGTVVDFGLDERQAIVEVESVWKGDDVPTLVAVDGGYVPEAVTSVDRAFAGGERYVFFPITDEPPYVDNACTSTQSMTPELEALAPDTASGPVPGEAIDFAVAVNDPGSPEPAPPPDGVDEVPPNDVEVVIDGPIPGPVPTPEPVRTPVAATQQSDAADSYVLPLAFGTAVIAVVIGGGALVGRHRREEIE